MDDLKESMLLWLPSYMVEDKEAVDNVTKANGIVMDFLDGDTCLEHVFDEFNDLGVDLDEYSEVLRKAIKYAGR